jgi:ATP synthase protein I
VSFSANKKRVSHIIYGQFVLMLFIAVIISLLRGIYAGVSAFAGGIASWLPTFIFARLVFSRPRSGKSFLFLFCSGELFRLLASAVLFVGVIRFLTNDALSAMTGFVATIVAFWIASVFYLARQPKREVSS